MNRFVVGSRGIRLDGLRQRGGAFALALSLVLGLGFGGVAATFTTTVLVSDPNPSVYGQLVAFTATVSPTPDGGTVTFKDGATDISGPVTVSSGQAQFSTNWLSVGAHSITAEYSGTTNYDASVSDPVVQTVNKAGTATTLTTSPEPSVVGETVTLIASVTASDPGGGPPLGTVTFTYEIGTPLGTAELVSSGPNWSRAVLTTDTLPIGAHTITAEYLGSPDHNGSSDTADHTVTKRETTTLVMGSDTPLVVGDTVTVTVRVVDTSPGETSMPTGNVTVSVSPTGQGNPTSWSHTLVAADAGQFTFTYTPSSAETATHTFTATYAGDSTHNGSSGSFAQAIIKRATDVQLTLNPSTAYIGQPVTVTVLVEDDTTAGIGTLPTGAVTFSDGGKVGVFSSDTATLSGGTCSVTYTPGPFDAGTTTIITATYEGSSVHAAGGAAELLAVALRPTVVTVEGCTNTILVNQGCNYTVTVEEVDGLPGTATNPLGTIAYSTYLQTHGGDATVLPASGAAPSGAFVYTCTGLDAEAGIDTIYADYTATDGIHADSSGLFGQGIQRRPTVTSVEGSSTDSGVTYTVTVEEDSSNPGTPTALQGDIHLLAPDRIACSGLYGTTLTCTDSFDTNSPLVNVTVQYEPTNRIHLGSTGSINIERYNQFPPDPGDGTDGSDCTDGCGSGGVNVAQMIFDLNAAIVALEAVKLGLDTTALVLDVIPDGVIVGGLVVSTGVTIPYSDIAKAIVAGAGIALDIAILAMETDLDGDGIPDVLEENVTGTDYNKWDTDGDGIDDYGEILEAGGYYGGTRRPSPNVADSDGDGLSDGEEVGYNTSFCVADTDCDSLTDKEEVDTWGCADPRDHADPLMIDTDGDGLNDDIEFSAYPGCASCPYVNDDDSDDDGLQDGYEDKNKDGTWGEGGTGITTGTSITQATKTAAQWETHLCVWDTDGDGLGDGEEEGLFGAGEVTPEGVSATVGAAGPSLAITVPALDSDMDNDGLSDYDETNVYQTDAMDADTDNDTISDSAEVATWADGDARNHANPREADTDGDGLTDDLEIAFGCTFVNDDDSDDDGLQDGYEDRNRDGVWDFDYASIGGSTSQSPLTFNGTASETNPCDWGTDGDGLSDGVEEGLFGTSVVPKGVSAVVGAPGPDLDSTVPALDTDMDNDFLTDYEEINIYGTNPLAADTDNDTLMDSIEIATWDAAIAARLVAAGIPLPFGGSTTSSADARDHSNPLMQDTDGDGLTDDLEIRYGCAGGCTNVPCNYTFVNDADSDDDGLQDGWEDRNRDGNWDLVRIGDSTTAGQGETCPCNPDTDGDGLSDGEEEGLLGRTATPQGVSASFGVDGLASTATVPALDDDSDNDGLSDWEEVNVTGTNPLDADTDNDTLSDANELIATGGAWPKRTFIQESDPLDPDTDDDDLHDYIEYPGSGLGTTRGLGGTPDLICPYVNDDDSDDDGLQDGYEDQNKDGIWNNYQIGDSTTQGWGETCACNPDSDGDGLQDGEEEGLLGRTAIPQGVSTVLPMGTSTAPPGYIVVAGSMRGTGNDLLAPYLFTPTPGPALAQTVPALDTDSDNDGLSDYEEIHITGTDPLDADSDNDTLADADELIAVSGTWPKRQFDQVSDPLSTNTDGDHLFDPQEFAGSGLSTLAGGLGGTPDLVCPYVNDADSDDDGVQDGAVVSRTFIAAGVTYSWTHYEDFADIAAADVAWPGTVRLVVTDASGEQQDDSLCNVCDPDSDGDGLLDGEEIAIGTDPGNWDTDGDGRNDWHEVTGGGPIPTDPFDPDTDDDGLLDSAEVFGSNPTNPANCDTDADGLCDGGNRTPYMTSGHPSVVVNPRCLTGIGGHPNPLGIGEDEDGEGDWDSAIETNPNNPDTDGDAVGDGIERLSFSVSRQSLIPKSDLFGREITVTYPMANNTNPVCGCMNPLNPDSDGDGLLDGEEDLNHDGHFDFLVSDFDYGHHGPIPGPAYGSPLETNPCDPDTDHDGLTDWEELRGQRNPPGFFPFNPTNPLDHDTDNDWLLDGEEVDWVCRELTVIGLDNDGDGLIDEDPVDGVDNDGDGYVDEDDVDFYVRFVPVLDPTDRDSDSDGFIDGLDFGAGLNPDPCNSQPIPIVHPVVKTPVDTDEDGFADDDEIAAGTDPRDAGSFPSALTADLDLDGVIDDRLWLSDADGDGMADTVTIDIDSNVLIDIRVQIVSPRDVQRGDLDGDGEADDCRYTITYAFANRRVIQPRITLVIYDYDCDLVINKVDATK